MKKLLVSLLLVSFAGVAQTPGSNYIKTKVYKAPSTGPITSTDTLISITYFDELGRPVQKVDVGAGGQSQDIITPIIYNDGGSLTKQYLPYADTQQTAQSSNYRDNGMLINNLNAYYQNKFPGELSATSPNPYTESVVERSPLERLQAQGAPGEDWKVSGDHKIQFSDGHNSMNEVYSFSFKYTINNPKLPFISGIKYYPQHVLSKKIIRNENWTLANESNKTIEYTDKEGRLVLKRSYENNIPYDTYYVYDKYSNLIFVIPPKAVENIVTTTSPPLNLPVYSLDQIHIDNLCYSYRYDERNRVYQKRIPGKDWEDIVYDKLDRVILSQDALLKANRKWLFTKYDIYGRITYTGEYSYTAAAEAENTREALQGRVYLDTVATESRTATPFTNSGATVHYTNDKFPNTNITLLTVNYYDDYAFDTDGIDIVTNNNNYLVHYSSAKGLSTGSKVKVLGTNAWTTTINRYDKYGNLVFKRSSDRYFTTTTQGTIVTLETKPDFTGQIKERRYHIARQGGFSSIVLRNSYMYDHAGRLLRNVARMNQDDDQLMAWHKYDELGRLVEKKVGGVYNDNTVSYDNTPGLQTQNFSYNIRGWLTAMNNPDNLGNDLFAYAINYNTGPAGATKLYNGNINSVFWKSAVDNQKRCYTYTYDALNRLKTATFTNADNPAQNNSFNIADMQYDKNGNITFMNRAGDKMGDPGLELMDYMTYTYDGNKLLRIKDDGNTTKGFKTDVPATDTNPQYSYDANGNITADRNKKITNITYNHFNLPVTMTLSNGSTVEFTYDALGTKLSKKYTNGSTVTLTEYLAGVVYVKQGTGISRAQYFTTEEGYVSIQPNAPTFTYVYQYKDHLGNVRLSYKDVDNNGTISANEIIEENNYDPFGLEHTGYNNVVLPYGNSFAQKIGFNGVEFDETLNMNEMDWRQYDPATARWTTIDPIIHFNMSPYVAFNNNPVFFIDPEGTSSVMSAVAAGLNAFMNSSTTIMDLFYNAGSGITTIFNNGKGGFSGFHVSDDTLADIGLLSREEYENYYNGGGGSESFAYFGFGGGEQILRGGKYNGMTYTQVKEKHDTNWYGSLDMLIKQKLNPEGATLFRHLLEDRISDAQELMDKIGYTGLYPGYDAKTIIENFKNGKTLLSIAAYRYFAIQISNASSEMRSIFRKYDLMHIKNKNNERGIYYIYSKSGNNILGSQHVLIEYYDVYSGKHLGSVKKDASFMGF